MTCTKLISMVFLISLITLSLEECAEKQDECGGPLSTTPFKSIPDTAKYYSRCTFPTHKLNVDCVLSSCPMLSGLCPLKSGCVDQTALDTAVSTLNTCLKQNELICGINMTSTPMVQLGWTTKELLPIDVANGTCMANPGKGYLNGLSSAQYAVCPAYNTNGLINLSIQTAKINNTAYFDCIFKLPPASFLEPLTSMFPFLSKLNMQNTFGLILFNVSTTVSFDLSTQPPTINSLDDHSTHFLNFNNFVSSQGICLPLDLVELFNQKLNQILEVSVLSTTATNFLSTYAALSLQAAQQNCSQ